MQSKDVHAERLGTFDRLKVRRGKCPACGHRLVVEKDRDAITAWLHIPGKHDVRVIGGARFIDFPAIRNVEVLGCKRCTASDRWFIGRWAYRRDGSRAAGADTGGGR